MHNQDLKFVYRIDSWTCCNSVFWCFRLTFVLILFSFSYLSRCLLQLNSCCRGHSSQKKKEAIGQNEKRWKKGEKTFFGPRMLHFKNGRQKKQVGDRSTSLRFAKFTSSTSLLIIAMMIIGLLSSVFSRPRIYFHSTDVLHNPLLHLLMRFFSL